jgi:hypothetical protein
LDDGEAVNKGEDEGKSEDEGWGRNFEETETIRK